MGALYLVGPILAVGLIVFLTDRHRPDFPNAREGRMLPMLLLLLLLSAAGTFGYYLGAFFIAVVAEGNFSMPVCHIITLSVMALMAYILLLIARGFARMLSLNRKNRSISLTVMTLLLAAESYAAYIYISGQFI